HRRPRRRPTGDPRPHVRGAQGPRTHPPPPRQVDARPLCRAERRGARHPGPGPAGAGEGGESVSPTFTSLSVRNYRVYASGAIVSNTGTWMGRVAQDWLVLTVLTDHSATALGTITG